MYTVSATISISMHVGPDRDDIGDKANENGEMTIKYTNKMCILMHK